MQQAERFVFLAHYPLFLVECNVDDIFCVLPIIYRVIINPSRLNCKGKRDLEKESSCVSVILAASFYMLNENFSWEKYLAEFTLH